MVEIKGGRKMKGKDTQVVQPGERLLVLTPSGGGFGSAETRDATLIANDVREERTSQRRG